MLGTMLLILSVLALQPAAVRRQVASSDDLGVYKAVLANKVQPEVDRFSVGAAMPTPAPILMFDRTLMVCRPAADHPKQMGCMRDEEIQSFETKLPRMQRVIFEGLLGAASREELAKAFRERNREPQPIPWTTLEGVVVTSPEGLDEAMKRESGRTRGITSLSLPAYSADGHALVYGSYVCGGLCGYGWLFLLERQGDAWRVVSADMLWIS
jgi:hypothetical protein